MTAAVSTRLAAIAEDLNNMDACVTSYYLFPIEIPAAAVS